MQLTINGEIKQVSDHLSVTTLLQELGLDTRKIAVERNREIVAKSTYTNTKLTDDDQIEIVAFIGGG
jgi:thiamine biosynthesis protein ThiS